MSVRVGVVTVTYRGGDAPSCWARALEVAETAAAGAVELRAVAVDCASGDGTAARLRAAAPWVEVHELERNAGFAAGVNAGLEQIGGVDVIAVVNPDVRVDPDFLRVLARLAWPPDLAARGPLVHGLGGTVEQSARGFPRAATALFGRTSLLARAFPGSRAARRELRADPAAGTADVDWVSGACLITTPAVLAAVGPFDTGYFMYWEDADWCRRAHDRGLRVAYEPSLVVRHDQGSSSRSRPAATVVAFHRSAWRYWHRHVAGSRRSSALAALALGVRCAIKLVPVGLAALRAGGGGARARRRS